MIPFQIPGVTLVLTKHGLPVIDQAFGFANVRQSIPASTDCLHRIASISKVFTRAAIMRLVYWRKLSLQTKVFPEVFGDLYDFACSPCSELITIDHLLNHMVGQWPTTTRSIDPIFKSSKELTFRQLIQSVLKETKIDPDSFGQNYLYSNFGYFVLGRVIENLTGKSYL